MKVILGLLSAVGALLAALFYEREKSQVNETLVQNTKVKEQLAEKDKEITANNNSLSNEAVTRQQLAEDIKKDQNEKDTTGDVSDFFNKRKD